MLNPLALIEFVGNGHNDALMITWMLLAIVAHLRSWWPAAIAALTLAVLTKWIAFPLLPLYGLVLLWAARSHWQRVVYTVGSLAIFAGLSAALYAPYWEAQGAWSSPTSRHTLKILVDAPPQKRVINSLGELAAGEYGRAMWLLGKWPDPALVDLAPLNAGNVVLGDHSDDLGSWQTQQHARYQRFMREQSRTRDQLIAHQKAVQALLRNLGLLILVAACLVGAALTRSLRTMLAAGAWILFVYTTVAAVWVWPWYATWFVALAALLDWRVTGRAAVGLSVLALLLYPLFPALPEPGLLERYRALLVFGPPLVFAAWHGLRLVREWWHGPAPTAGPALE